MSTSALSSRRAHARAAAAPTPAVAGFRPAAIALAIAFAVQQAPAQTQPRAVLGSAALSQQGRQLLVTTRNGAGTQHSVIDWQSFSVAPGTVTRFLQPDAGSTSINRVLGPDPSRIHGTLSSNGRLVLVNPAGIAVGPGGVVDTAGFIASTLRMSDADAASARLRFSGGQTAGAVAVQGRVLARGGDVVLVGPAIEIGAEALVTSPKGAAILAAGRKVDVTGRGLEGIHLELQAPADRALNLGRIEGDAVGLFAGTLRHSGLLQATAATDAGGKVVLKAQQQLDIAGRIEAARGASGGQVHATGREVLVRAGAVLDASGRDGGGEVLVGGGWQGHDARVANAHQTVLETGATLRANATGHGDGGTVVVWSDDRTRVGARIEARGGPRGGDGGAVETSGKETLVFRAQVDTSAPRGRAGTLLLDPRDITIVDGAGGGDDTLVGDNTVTAGEGGTGTDVTLSQRTLESLSGNVSLAASRDVIFGDLADDSLALSGVGPGATFSVDAGRHIVQADRNDRVRTGGGHVSMATTNGRIDLGGVLSNGGNIVLTAGGTGAMTLAGVDARGNAPGLAGDVRLVAANAITVASAGTLHGNHLSVDAIGGFGNEFLGAANTSVTSLQARNQGGGGILVSNSGALLVTDTGSLGYGVRQASGSGRIALTAGSGLLSVQAGVATQGGAIDLASPAGGLQVLGSTIDAAGGNITLNAIGTSDAHAVQIANSGGTASTVKTSGAGTITIRGELTGGGSSGAPAGGVTISNSGIQAAAGAISVTGVVGPAVTGASRGFLVDGGSTVTGGGAVSLIGQTQSPHSTSGMGGEILAGGVVSSSGGNVSVAGTFLSPSAFAGTGLRIAGTVRSTGATSIALQGSASVGPSSGNGVVLDTQGQLLPGTLGLTVTASVSSSTTATNIVAATVAGSIQSPGDIAITGTVAAPSAPTPRGVYVTGSIVATGAAGITITGSGVPAPAPASSYELQLIGTTISSAGGQVKLVGDRIDIGTNISAGGGVATILPRSANREVVVGNTGNEANSLRLSSSELGLVSAGRLEVGSTASTGEIVLGSMAYSRPLSLVTRGAVRQVGAVSLSDLHAEGSSVDLSNGGNSVTLLSGRAATGNFTFVSGASTEISALPGTSGIAAPSGRVLVNTGGQLTQDGAVTAGGSGDAVVLAGSTYRNNGGSVTATGGRWLVYSSDPAGNSFGGLASGNNAVWNATYAGNAPSTIPAGNRYVFALRPNVSVSANAFSRVYDGTATFAGLGYASSGLVDAAAYGNVFLQDSFSGALAVASPGKDVGSYTIAQGTLAAPSGYQVSYTSAQATVTPKPITVTGLAGVDRVYDGGTAATLSGTATLVGVESVDAGAVSAADTASGSFADRHVGTGKPITTAIRLQGAEAGNYVLSRQPTVSADITQATLVISATTDSRGYDRTTASSRQASASGLASGDTVTGTSQSFTSRHARGTGGSTLVVDGYTVQDGNGGNNYSVVLQTATGTITPAALALSASTDSRRYDGGTASGGAVGASGLVSGDTVSATQSFTSRHVRGTGNSTLRVTSYSIADGNNGANYAVSTSDASGTITPAPLTLAAVSDSRRYDGGTSSSGAVAVGGLFGSDRVQGLTQSFDSRHVRGAGASTLAVDTGYTVDDGNGGANYGVSTTTASGTIAPAGVTLRAASESRSYDGGTASSGRVTASGLLAGDTLASASQSYASRHVLGTDRSTLRVDGYSIADGNAGGNYVVTTADAAGTITPAPLTLVAATDSRRYDGGTASAGVVTHGSLFGSDSISGLSQSFASRHVLGTNGSTLVVDGGYTIADGNGGANYAVATVNASGTLTRAPLQLTAASDTRGYNGGTASSGAVSASGLLGGDTLASGTQAFTSRHVAGSNGSTLSVISYTVADGNAGGNYTVRTVDAAGTITPATLALSAATDNRGYDGGTASAGAVRRNGLFGSDTVNGLTQSFTSRHVLGTNGSTLVVNGGYTVADGNGGANYTVATSSARGTITPAPLVLQAGSDSRGYDGGTASSATVTGRGLFGSDTFDATQKFTSRHVRGADGSTLVVDGFSVADGNGGANYAVSTQSATGTITPASLTLFAAADGRVYDGTTGSSGSVTHGSLFGSDSVGGLSQSFASRHVLGTNGSTLAVNGGYTIADGNGGANYALTKVTANGTITPAQLSLAAASDARTYDGGTASAGAVTASGLFGSDAVNGATQSFTSRHVLGTNGSTLVVDGGYTVADGNGGANYTVATSSARGTITPAALVLQAGGDSRGYDGGTASSATVTGRGLFGADTFDATQKFTSRHVRGADGSTLVVDGFSVADGNGGANYAVSTQSASGTITPAALTLSASADGRVYDGTTGSTGSVTHGSLFGSDSIDGLSQSFASRHVLGTNGSTLVVDGGYALADGNGGRNYAVRTQAATGTITPAAITVASSDVTRTYDGSLDAAGSAVLAGGTLFQGDALAGGSFRFTDRHAGTGKTITAAGVQVDDGNHGGNYSVRYADNRRGAITVRPLSVWTGGAGDGRWSSAANWDALPDAGNVRAVRIPDGVSVLYDLAGPTLLETLTSGGVLRLASGTLAMAGALTTQGYEQQGGVLAGAGSLAVGGSFRQSGGAIDLGGAVDITQAGGDLRVGAIRAAGIALRADDGAIRQSGALVTDGLLATRSGGATLLDTADNRVAAFRAVVQGAGDLRFANTGPLDVQGLATAAGSIALVNTGGVRTSGAVQASGGSVAITANSPLTIGAPGVTASGDIRLVASNRTSAGDLTLDGEVRSTGGGVSLSAGRDLAQNGLVAGARGVDASAQGSMRFAPGAKTQGRPVHYAAAGTPVQPPFAAPASGSPRVDAAVALLGADADADTVAKVATALQQSDDNLQVFATLLRQSEDDGKAKDKPKVAIDVDGASCKR